MRISTFPLLALTAALAGVGCDSGTTLQLHALGGGPTLRGMEHLVVEVEQAGREWRFTAADFKPDGANLTPHTKPLSLNLQGPIVVRAGLIAPTDTQAFGSIELTPRDDFEWHVFLRRDTANLEICSLCFGQSGFPILESAAAFAGEHFWIQWTGKSKGEPAW